VNITRYGDAGPGPKGSVMTVVFELDGQEYTALNGGPQFKFTEAISFSVHCKTQEEVDKFWEELSEGGEEGPCGWLKDKYGLSWQINPSILGELLNDPDPEKSKRVSHAQDEENRHRRFKEGVRPAINQHGFPRPPWLASPFSCAAVQDREPRAYGAVRLRPELLGDIAILAGACDHEIRMDHSPLDLESKAGECEIFELEWCRRPTGTSRARRREF